MIPPLTDRISLLDLVNARFPSGIGVEIGVAGGHFTKQIVATWQSMMGLICVDPWKHFPEGYSDSCNLSQQVQDERYAQFVKDFSGDKRIVIRRQMSHEASQSIEQPESVAFIYLDANHSFTEVMRDLTCWWPILKPGGIFAGHDYYDGNGRGHGVKLAVDAFAEERGIEVHRTTSDYCRADGVYGAGWEGYSFVMEKPI